MSAQASYTKKWVDDYLDLYNYASQIGDTDWQQVILRQLAEHESLSLAEQQSKLKDELWRKFDSVNNKLLELFRELRSSTNQNHTENVMEQLILLKQQRVEIRRKLEINGNR